MSGLYLIFFVVLLALFIKNVGRFVGRIVPQRNLPWILGCYLIILFSSLLVLPMLPKESFPDTVSEKVLNQAERAYLDFQKATLEGRPEQIDGVYKLKQWDFVFSGDQLQIAGADNDYGVMVIADKKDTNDGKIEVINYATKTILEGIDVTNDTKAPKVSLEGNRLKITMPERYKVEIAKFNKDFVVTQLSKDGREQNRHTVIGSQVLYLRIPKEVKIDDTKPGILFIAKE